MFVSLQPTKLALRGGQSQDIDGTPEADDAVCREGRRERTFSERYLSVISNLATLNPFTAVMQRSVRVGVLYPGCSLLSLYLGNNVPAELYNHSAWAGLRCLSLKGGNAKA